MVGTVTISVETEPGWVIHDRQEYDHLGDDGSQKRRYLDACDDYGISISADIVGYLLPHSCAGDRSGPYPEGWFDEDPETDMGSDPLFYAPDIAAEITRCRTDHEISTHTFSRASCDAMPRGVQKQELEHAQRLHERVTGDRIESLQHPSLTATEPEITDSSYV